MTKDLPNTHSRSTAETAMNPIGDTIPVIHPHLEGNSEQPHQLLNLGRFKSSSDTRFSPSPTSTGTNIQIPTVDNVSYRNGNIFHDYGIHHSTCAFKTFRKKTTFSYPTDLVHVASITRMTSTIVFRIRCYVSVITEKYDLIISTYVSHVGL